MNTFFDPVNNTAAVEQLNKELGKDGGRTVLISGCIDTQKVHISSAIASGYKYMLIVTSDEAKARKMCDDASFFNREAIYYPAKDAIFYSADVHGNQITGERLRCISRIINHSSTGEGVLTVVTTMDGIADRLIPVERFKEAVITLDYSSEIEPEKLAKKLVAMGFVRTGMVEDKGQFAIRGGIIDIFSYTDEAPVRIELWDTEVDSIRMFDVESQSLNPTLFKQIAGPTVQAILLGFFNFYMMLLVIGLITLITEWKKILAPARKKIMYLFSFPLFIATYIPISIVALFKKVEWKPIPHTVVKTIDDLSMTQYKQ